MIRKARASDWDVIWEFVKKDFARNYFIALGMIKGKETFKAIYIEDQKGILFHRTSGNLQFVNYGQASIEAFRELIDQLEFETLIGPKSMCQELNLDIKKHGALISELHKDNYHDVADLTKVKKLTLEELEEVEQLYSRLFVSYPKVTYMKEKLSSHRGMGYLIKDGTVVSVAQSDFGYLIVGVATEREHQHQGYASMCLRALIEEMFKTHASICLQYDNPEAGRLYELLGFRPIDQVIHYKKR